MAEKKEKKVKKTTTFKAAKKVEPVSEAPKQEKVSLASVFKSRNFIIPAVIILLLAGFYFLKNELIVATVNGKPITRFEVIAELEKQGGNQVLSSLVLDSLILQEAQKQNVTVTSEELDAEMAEIEATVSEQGQNFDELLAAQGMTREDVKQQIKMQKLAEKMAGKDISVTEEEVGEYVEANKAFFPENLGEEEIRTEAKAQLEDQKMSEQIQTWITSLKDGAKITYFKYY